MDKFKRFALKTLLASVALFAIISCQNVDFNAQVYGKVQATPSEVKNGEVIILTIGGAISSAPMTTINGKEYFPVIHYMIDGVEVAKSSEKELPFKATYQANELATGEHTLSVNVTGSRKGANFENKILNSTIIVVE